MTLHHKKCQSNGGATNSRNCVEIMQFLHNSWHNLFRNYQPDQIAQVINETYLDPDYYFVCIKKG